MWLHVRVGIFFCRPAWRSVGESLFDRDVFDHRFCLSRYLKGCPSCRQQWLPSRPAYEVVTSFLQSLVPSSEPRYAMFGPGMEQLDVSLVTRLMHSPDVLPVSGTPHRQINGETALMLSADDEASPGLLIVNTSDKTTPKSSPASP